jgi:GTPase
VHGFVDEAVIEVASGDGGAGAVSFRREKYVPRGGPDGGDGGDGGDVYFVVKSNLKTLSHLRNRRTFRAQAGGRGSAQNRTGAQGADIEIAVPPGTIITDADSGESLKDLANDGERWLFLRGGRGGKGNTHFATATHRTPRFAQPGQPATSRSLRVELNLIADIGLVGMPNAGKSTLISRLTRARPKVAPYPFTTLVPHLGVLRIDDLDIVIADIPGLIEGASAGAGMGNQFLRHVARTAALAYVVDLSDEGFASAVPTLEAEIKAFSDELSGRRRLVVANKLDMPEAPQRLQELTRTLAGDTVVGISALTGEGLKDLIRAFVAVVTKP